MVFKKIIERLYELIARDNTHPGDTERESLFFIIAGNDELWELQEQIYDFKDHSIKPEILKSGICTSSKTLIEIGFNLYNNSPTKSLIDCFSVLDKSNFELVMEAIRIRLNQTGGRIYENRGCTSKVN